MSVSNLLKDTTQDEEWSNLFMDKLNVNEVVSPQGFLVKGKNGSVPVENLTITTGSGSLATSNYQNTVITMGVHRQLWGNIRYTAIDAPTIDVGLCRFVFEMLVDWSAYYPPVGQNIPCSCSGNLIETVGANVVDFPQVSVRARLIDVNRIQFICDVKKDISAPLAGRNLDVQFGMTLGVFP